MAVFILALLTACLAILFSLLFWRRSLFKWELLPASWLETASRLHLLLPIFWPKDNRALQASIAVCLGLIATERAINILEPISNKWLVDELATPESFSYWLLLLSALLRILQGCVDSFRRQIWEPIELRTVKETQVCLFSHLHSLSLRWHLSRKTGTLLRVMERGSYSLQNIFDQVFFQFGPTLADLFLAAGFFLSSFDSYIGFVVILSMIIYGGLTYYVSQKQEALSKEENEGENDECSIGTDSLLNFETVKYYGNEQYEISRYRQALERSQGSQNRRRFYWTLLDNSQSALITAAITACSALLISQMKSGATKLTVGDYVLLSTYLAQLYSPIGYFASTFRYLQHSFVGLAEMLELLAQEAEVRDAPDAVEFEYRDGSISVADLCFEYTPGYDVLNDISFNVKNGETIALVGPSGSGKSTMIRLLFRLFESGSGRIEFDGQDVKKISLASLRRQIGIVPQDTVLFNDTIRYNIRFGRTTATDEEVEAAAKAAMIHDKILQMPNGYETVVGERGLKLSGGEKQRVAIARTILKQPRFIFLDEATSALDTHTEQAIHHSIMELCANRTTVIVAHRLSTIAYANCILVLGKGRIIERGTHSSLLASGGEYARMWASQMAESFPDRHWL